MKKKNQKTRIKRGDLVRVITGGYKGEEGKITSIKHDYITIGGVALRTRKIKQGENKNSSEEFEGKIHISNVMILDSKTSVISRIGYKINEKGEKERFAKKTGEIIQNNRD